MDEVLLIVFLAIIGAGVGSFASTLVIRLNRRQGLMRDYSRCEKCKHKLSCVDLIPIFGWLLRRGRCKYCNDKIDFENLLVEIITAIVFVASYVFWPNGFSSWLEIVRFGFWLVVLSHLIALAIYDIKFLKLPNKIIFPATLFGATFWMISATATDQIMDINHWLDLTLAMLPIAGIYGLLYLLSHGEKVGLGDVRLGAIIGFILPWQGGLVTLFLANILLIVTYLILSKNFSIAQKVPLGAALIVATIIVFICLPKIMSLLG